MKQFATTRLLLELNSAMMETTSMEMAAMLTAPSETIIVVLLALPILTQIQLPARMLAQLDSMATILLLVANFVATLACLAPTAPPAPPVLHPAIEPYPPAAPATRYPASSTTAPNWLPLASHPVISALLLLLVSLACLATSSLVLLAMTAPLL